MKQRKYYQLPKNWRKIKRSIERDLHKANKDYTKKKFDLFFIESMRLYSTKSQLEKELNKLRDKIWHRYENAYVFNGKLDLGEQSPFILSPCDCYGENGYGLNVERRRLNTAYHNDESNYTTCCIHCYIERYNHYEELWQDYYSSRL